MELCWKVNVKDFFFLTNLISVVYSEASDQNGLRVGEVKHRVWINFYDFFLMVLFSKNRLKFVFSMKFEILR